MNAGVRGVGPTKGWPWERVPRGRGWGRLSKEGQIMNRASAPSWGLLSSAKRWAKTWKLGIDKVQRDVGDPARGPALQREGKAKSYQSEPKEGHTAEPHSSCSPCSSAHSCNHSSWPTHHAEQSSFVEGRMESDELGLGSWLPLDSATRGRRKGEQAAGGRRQV